MGGLTCLGFWGKKVPTQPESSVSSGIAAIGDSGLNARRFRRQINICDNQAMKAKGHQYSTGALFLFVLDQMQLTEGKIFIREALGVALPLDWFINVSIGIRTLYFTGSALLLCSLMSVSVCRSCRQGCRQSEGDMAGVLCYVLWP